MLSVHPVTYLTFPDFIHQFGYSSDTRQRLMKSFNEARQSLYEAGTTKIFVGGSFIDSKPNPHDVDLVVLLSDPFDPDALLDLKNGYKSKGLDIAFCVDVNSLSLYLSFIGHNRNGKPIRVIELIDSDSPPVRLVLNPGYMTDSIYAFKLTQSYELLAKVADQVERQAIKQYIDRLKSDYKKKSVQTLYQQCLTTEVTMPGRQGESDIQINSLVGLFLQEEKPFTLVDFGCGQGRLIAVLASLDETILNNLSYLGVDFDTTRAEAFSAERKFDSRCKSVAFTTFDDFYKSNQTADYILSINVVHEVSAEHFYNAVYLPIFYLTANGRLVIHDMERLPFGELGFVPWSGDLLKAFLGELRLPVQVRRHLSNGGIPLYSLVIRAVPSSPLSKLNFDTILLRYYQLLRQYYQKQRKSINITERLYGYYSVVIANITDNIAILTEPSTS